MEYIFNTHDSFPLPRPRREEVEKLLLGSRMTKFVNAQHVDNVQMCRKPSAVFKPDIGGGGQGAVWVGCVVCFVSCPIASPELDLTEVRAQAGLWGRCCMTLVIISLPLPCILYSLIEGKGDTTCRSATSMQRKWDCLSRTRIGLCSTGYAQTECCWQQFKCIDAVFIVCILDDGNEQMGCLVAVHTCQGTEGTQEEGQGQETGCSC